MSTIQGLLRLAASQSADELLLREGDPPLLRVSGAVRRLSMPVMDGALVLDTLREVVGDEAARSDGDGKFPIEGHGIVRARWRRLGRLEVTFAIGKAAHLEPRAETPKPATSSHLASTHLAPSTRVQVATAITTSASSTSASTPLEASAARRPPIEPHDRLGALLVLALERGASDLVLAEGKPVAAKVQGEMVRFESEGYRTAVRAHAEGAPLSGAVTDVAGMILPHLDTPRRIAFETRGSADFAVELALLGGGVARFRGSLFSALGGASAVLRPIRGAPPSLRELRLPESIARFVEQHDGLVLVTGAAGSGKSTTLVSLVAHVDRAQHARHIITLEDPIEYVFSPERAVIHQREVGVHVSSFAEGLRAALREAPDVILLGEMRDPETIAAAVTAAETGHLVLSTLHAGSAGGAIDRIVDVFPEHQQKQVRAQLADVLRGVVTQRLIPSRDGGRVPAVEVLPMTYAVANLIREGKTFQIPQVLQTGRDAGMVPMARALAELVKTGQVERDVARRYAPDAAHFDEQLRGK